MSALGMTSRRSRPRWTPAFLPLVVVVIGFAGAGFVWLRAIEALNNSRPVPVTARPSAVVWGDRVFANKTRFADWLAARGLSYQDWAAKHPAGLRILDPAELRAQAATAQPRQPTHAATGKTTPTTGKTAVPARTATKSTGSGSSFFSPGLQLFAALLVLILGSLASLPRSVIWRLSGQRLDIVGERRYYFVAAALSVGLGLLVGVVAG